ncbi:diguanylate cyclase domain-containing protein [Psychromonas sp. KJ10-10]|uniref:diguanylate cyclase domain-containing protein n=1 Tax=Psychromonas sp. KJ10-10 TaxID=3391823 RepID=UPI0039B4FF26
MQLRHLFVITFCVLVIVPMTLFWVWPYSKALESEIEGVNQKHLLIAKNLSATFELYYKNVTDIFSIIPEQSDEQLKSKQFQQLLNSYKFTQIMLIDENGNVNSCLFSHKGTCLKKINEDILTLTKQTLADTEIKISTVTEDKTINSGSIFLVVEKRNSDVLLGYLSTEYLVKMGKQVAFGQKGYAVIVDQDGNVLTHPLESWVKERQNISKISPVLKMLEGKSGIEQFYSPALQRDMIAGYTRVANAQWGVMVSQPLKELEDRAQKIDTTASLLMLLGLGLALLVSIPVSFILIKPLDNLLKANRLIEQGGTNVSIQQNLSKIIPLEIRELTQSFSNIVQRIEKNKEDITQLAFFDSNTGLPNRKYFYVLANKALEKMIKRNQKGALVIIDFDGFKSINDIYGHRAGDELLLQFGQRVSAFFSLSDEETSSLLFCGPLPKIIPARLGGDEFVILLQNIEDKNEAIKEIETLFNAVFSTYILYGELTLNLTGSAGIALFPEHGESYNELMKLADSAMSEAKTVGNNTIRFSAN